MKTSNRDLAPPSPPPFTPYVVELTIESADEEKALTCILNSSSIINTVEEMYHLRDFSPWKALRTRMGDHNAFIDLLRVRLR